MAGADEIRPVPNDRLEIRAIPHKGRGVFTCAPIAAGTIIEIAPVIILPAVECATFNRTVLHDYYFHWDGDRQGEGRGALALGLLTLCNHSSRPRARVERNHDRRTLDLIAIADIAAGEEITIEYGELWFAPRD